jgi:hypothetical protein
MMTPLGFGQFQKQIKPRPGNAGKQSADGESAD